jgi:hypothetical protein
MSFFAFIIKSLIESLTGMSEQQVAVIRLIQIIFVIINPHGGMFIY